MRKAAIASGVLGLIFLILAGLLAWWITPSYVARVPGDYNKTRTYTAMIHSLFDPAAFASGNLAGAIKTGLPGQLTDNVRTQQTSGNTALMQDTRNVKASGSLVGSLVSHYALNRQTLMPTRSHPSNWSVTNASGLTVSWPFGAKKQTYNGWIPYTESSAPVRFVREVQQGGINTFEYHATVPPTPITNPQVLAKLPKSLPTSLLPSLTAAHLISPAQIAGLSRAFPGATTIPLGYTYQASNNYFVDPHTGLVVNVNNSESQMGGIKMPTGQVVPILPVLSDSYHATSSSLSQAVTDAKNGGGIINTLGVALPIALASFGFLLVVAAILLWLRKRSRGRPVEREHPERHPSPAGTIR